MFEAVLEGAAPLAAGADLDQHWLDPVWLDQPPEPDDVGQPAAASCAPSGWTALELDHGTADPARLSDADLIDAMVGFERVASWAGARQAELIAEFARRRGELNGPPARSDVPARYSGFAPDEIALALRLSRTTATNLMVMAQTVVSDLPATLDAWVSGAIDARKAAAIAETSYVLTEQQRATLEARVLPRAGTQTLAQLRASLARAVLAIDPEGAAARFRERRKDRRVVVGPDSEGMASLWALLSAPDATATYQRLSELARESGAEDPRGMDARRADLLVDLLTGRRCAATATPLDDTDPDPTADHTDRAEQDTDRGGDDAPTATPAGTEQTTPAQSHHDCPGGRSGKPLVSVLVPITMLLGLDETPGELVGYGPIPAELAREIAAQGTWRRLLTDPASGVLLDYGRKTYTPPAGLADFVRARDLTCRNPGCRHRAATADLDHTIPWNQGGTTSEGNLYACCRHDHLVKTFGPGWKIEQHPDGRVSWTTPTGHVYTSRPHDYRPDPHPPPEATTSRTMVPETTAGHDPPQDDELPF